MCAFVFFRKLPMSKTPNKDGYLIVAKFGTVAIIVYSVVYAIIEADFIYGFFTIDYSEFYSIVVLFSLCLFMGLFISKNFKKE